MKYNREKKAAGDDAGRRPGIRETLLLLWMLAVVLLYIYLKRTFLGI